MEASFFERVYDVARHIPEGRVTSYGAIATFIGAARSARMVGWAMQRSGSVFPPVPAHRVVNRKGLLTGKHAFQYPEQMQELLEEEGVLVRGNQVQDFKSVFWDPLDSLNMSDFQ